jgi:hypothetical protein
MAGTASAHQHVSADAPPFTVDWAPAVLTVEPSFGMPGSVVQIFGAPFHNGVEVYFGDHPMPILAANDHMIVAMVPYGVHGQNYIFLTDFKSDRARTDDMFMVERQHGGHFHRW